MFARAVLLIPGALFFVYGAICWYNPELLAEYAGLWVAHQDGLAELAAMYGGLQLCLGSIIFLSGILKGYLRPGLWLAMMVLGGLAAARGSVAFGNFASEILPASWDPVAPPTQLEAERHSNAFQGWDDTLLKQTDARRKGWWLKQGLVQP